MTDDHELPPDSSDPHASSKDTNRDEHSQRSDGAHVPGADGRFDDGFIGPIPNELQNWRVVMDLPVQARTVRMDAVDGHEQADIDIEITPAASTAADTVADTVDNMPEPAPIQAEDGEIEAEPILPRTEAVIDSMVVASVAQGPHRLNPGGEIQLDVRLVNNGDAVARFHLHPAGWGEPDWITVRPGRRKLMPGDSANVTLTISPPRSPLATAGLHELLVEVQADAYPGRQTRLPVLLDIAPYDDVLLTDLRPDLLRVTPGARVARSTVSIFNNGNRPASVRLSGLSPDLHCDFGFARVDGQQMPGGVGSPTPLGVYREELTLDLAPNEFASVRVALRPRRVPLLGLRERVATVRIVASVLGKSQVPRAASARLVRTPLLGALHLGVGLLLLFLTFFMVVMLGAVGMGVTQLIAQRNAPRALPVQTQPQVVIVVPVNEPVPAPADAAASPAAGLPAALPAAEAPPPGGSGPDSARDPSVPLVGAGQVSAPGADSADSAPSDASAPAPAAVPVDRANMTYAQLFQEIGGKYDLDWRMLAAQAYVESRFDTLALGSAGDLGLMQVLPSTWQEWAPVADVNDPFDAYSNVLVAAAYLDYLRDQFARRGLTEDHWMLVAYNWGPDKVLSLVDAGSDWMDLDPGMRQYALDVLSVADTIPFE